MSRRTKVCLFFLMIGTLAFSRSANAEGSAKETYRDLIEKARGLSLQRDRLQATKILVRGLEKEKSAAAKTELLRSLQELGEVFYTEKAQQAFELGESIRYTAPKTAEERFREALQLEPGHLGVLRALARSYLTGGQCEDAAEQADLALAQNPFSDEIHLLKAQALACQLKVEEAKKVLKRFEAKKNPLKLYVELARAQIAYFEDKIPLAKESVKRAVETDAAFPESYYWLSQIRIKEKADFVEMANRYIQLCQKVDAKIRRKYEFEPRICLEKEAIEKAVEKEKTAKQGGA